MLKFKVLGSEVDEESYKLYKLLKSADRHSTNFEEIYLKNNKNIKMSLIEYRDILLHRVSVTLGVLLDAFVSGIEAFRKALEELFLEIIDQNAINYIMAAMKKNSWTIEKLYNEHLKRLNKKVEYLVSMKCA